jgi:hypothetical protein
MKGGEVTEPLLNGGNEPDNCWHSCVKAGGKAQHRVGLRIQLFSSESLRAADARCVGEDSCFSSFSAISDNVISDLL